MPHNPFSTRSIPPVIGALLAINIAVYFLSNIAPGLVVNYALWPLGQNAVHSAFGYGLAPSFMPWQLLSYGFLHASLSHLFFNMFGLWMFGRAIEMVWGSQRLLLYYLVCVAGAAVCQLLVLYFFQPGVGIPTIGASGGVFGILLAFGMLFPNARVMLIIPPIPMTAKWLVIGYGAVELFSGVTGTQAGVAHFAHLGGMLFGFGLIYYWRHYGRHGRR